MIAKRALRTGDKTWQLNSTAKHTAIDENDVEVDYDNMGYGWNDSSVSEEAKRNTKIIN